MQKNIRGLTIKPGIKNDTKWDVIFIAGGTIAAGDILYISGAAGALLELTRASSAAPATARGTLFVAKSPATSGQKSVARFMGALESENTSAGSVGDPVFLSTAGGWALTPGAVSRVIGYIAESHASTGEIAFDGTLVDDVVKRSGVVTIDMADAAHTLVYGTAAAAQSQLTGNVLFVDPNSGQATENLDLPAFASSKGVVLHIFNTGGEGIVVRAPGPVTVITLDTAQHGVVACDGTAWRGFMGNIT